MPPVLADAPADPCADNGCGRQAAESRSAVREPARAAGTNSNHKAAGPRSGTSARRAPMPRPAGVARSCPMTHPVPARADAADVRRRIERIWHVRLTGSAWSKPGNRPALTALWQTLDAIDCTPFVATARHKNKGRLTLSGQKSGSWAWGDYGLSKAGTVSLDLGKLTKARRHGQDARVTRVLVHEMAHAWSADRDRGGYFRRFERLRDGKGITEYGSQSASEDFAEAAGYYVARCAVEQNDAGLHKPNPYDARRHADYYAYMKKTVFAGRTFGPEPGRGC